MSLYALTADALSPVAVQVCTPNGPPMLLRPVALSGTAGIDQLTGDTIAGPGVGSVASTTLGASGPSFTVASLAAAGTRMVTASPSGVLGSQPLPAGGGNVFVYRAGATPAGNVYADFPSAYAARIAYGVGFAIIQVDDSLGGCDIPAGAYNLFNT